MGRNRKRLVTSSILMLAASLSYGPIFAATPIDLSHHKLTDMQSIISSRSLATKGIKFEEFRRSTDFKQTVHVRIQETYMGYPVWGGDAIIHVPNGAGTDKSIDQVLAAAKRNSGSMDGTIYQDIGTDLVSTPSFAATAQQAQNAAKAAIHAYQAESGNKNKADVDSNRMIVFIDDDHKAHWAYQISFSVAPATAGALPAKPVYIIDATTLQVYAHWDNIKTMKLVQVVVKGGGFGGNKKMGKLWYDKVKGDLHLDHLKMTRDDGTSTCFLQNDEVTVKNYRGDKVMQFDCKDVDNDHNKLYWDGDFDAVNGGFNPSNDALFGGAVIKDLYQTWYNVPVLTKNGKPMMLNMIVHDHIDNAFWDGSKMTFGDGVRIFYPLTSLGVAAHEVSHGFTEQHSDLNYYSQPGGLNESFSDMAAQAAEVFVYGDGKNSWQIGPEIFKAENEALRYMDKPSKDCKPGRKPGDWCSIDDASQYTPGLDVHFSSGVYNHFFYLLGTTKGWDVRKAFDVMVHANMSYWTSSSNFVKAACGVLKATKDLGYPVDDVKKAFDGVKINTSSC